MSELLEALRLHAPLPAETAAALASHAPKTSASSIIDSARAACTRDGYTTSSPALCMALEGHIRDLCDEIAKLKSDKACGGSQSEAPFASGWVKL